MAARNSRQTGFTRYDGEAVPGLARRARDLARGRPFWPRRYARLLDAPIAALPQGLAAGAARIPPHVLEAPALVAGFDDFAVMRQPIEQRGRHLGVVQRSIAHPRSS